MCIRKNDDAHRPLFRHESSILTMNIIREEIIEHRLDDAFQSDHSSYLTCREVNVSSNIQNNNNDNNDSDVDDM